MEKIFLILMREPVCDSSEGEVTSYRFIFRKTPKSKVGTTEEPQVSSMFTVRLKVSNALLTTRLWPLTDHVNRVKCFYEFVRGELQRSGLSSSPVRELELNRAVKDADRLPEIHQPDKVQMYEGFYLEPVVNNKHLIGHRHRQ
jgi:hypothetical protein